MTVQAVFFDLDGTLIDTRELILDSFRYACDTILGYSIPDEQLLKLVGVPLPKQMEMLAPEHAEAMVIAYRENNRKRHDALIESFPGVRETLLELRERGLPLAVITSKMHEFAMMGLRSFDLEDFFEFLIGPDDCPIHKPEPEPLLLAAERLGLDPKNCVYIGDSPYDMQAAVAAGMRALGVEWGGMFDPECLWEAGAELLIPAFSEIPRTLDTLE